MDRIEYISANNLCTEHTFKIMHDSITKQSRTDIAIGLSIDGGGVKGLTSILFLEYLFGNKRISNYFELMTGTSTGGILVAALAATKNKQPIYSTKDVLEMYTKPKDLFRKNLLSIGGLFSSKYKSNEDVFKEILGDAKIQDTDTNLLITAWDKMKYFKNSRPNYFLYQVLTATSAAPTYFPSLILKNNEKHNREEELRDGGIGINDPSFSALTEMNLLRQSGDISSNKKYNFLLRIGTVSIGHLPRKRGPSSIISTIPHLTQMFMGVAESIVSENIISLMADNKTLVFNIDIPLHNASIEMDNTDKKNIHALHQDTEDYINKNKNAINFLKIFLEL